MCCIAKGLVAAALMCSIAVATPHRNAGTYRVVRTKATALESGTAPEEPTTIPACQPERPVPKDITILYVGPDKPSASVNGEMWSNQGLTRDYYTKRPVAHARVLSRPAALGATAERTSSAAQDGKSRDQRCGS